MTFSIVAVDRKAREVGFAIASCCWDAGQVCMARAEAGAIASQANGNMAFLPRFFDALVEGADPATILAGFRASDPEIESRQVGMVTFASRPLAFTGAKCSRWAGERVSDDYAIQGNTLVGPQVIDGMAEAFEQTGGRLYQRLYAALAAGDAAGGDVRGRESARLAVKRAGCGQPGTDNLVDFSIPDHADPVAELGRILGVAQTLVSILRQFGSLSEAADADKPALLAELRQTLDGRRDCRYLDWWEALGMAYHEIGDIDGAVDAFRIYLDINPALRPLLEANAECGAFPADLACRVLAERP